MAAVLAVHSATPSLEQLRDAEQSRDATLAELLSRFFDLEADAAEDKPQAEAPESKPRWCPAENEVVREASDGEDGSRQLISSQRPLVRRQLIQKEIVPFMNPRISLNFPLGMAWTAAHSWNSHFGLMGPDPPYESKVRVFVTDSNPSVMILENNSVATFNMMDPTLGADFEYAMTAMQFIHSKSHYAAYGSPQSLVMQGAGPHFCPGGNHHPIFGPGHTPLTMSVTAGAFPFSQLRESRIPSVVCMTGSIIGGGMAISTGATARVAAASASAAFGNISRGANPVMCLSQNLCEVMGFTNALTLYMGDFTLSSYAILQVRAIVSVQPTFLAIKTKALAVAKAIANHPSIRSVARIKPPIDLHRWERESRGMMLCSLSGTLFATALKPKILKSKKKEEPAHEVTAVPVQEEPEPEEPVLKPEKPAVNVAEILSEFFDRCQAKHGKVAKDPSLDPCCKAAEQPGLQEATRRRLPALA